MKRLSFLALAVAISTFGYAEETTSPAKVQTATGETTAATTTTTTAPAASAIPKNATPAGRIQTETLSRTSEHASSSSLSMDELLKKNDELVKNLHILEETNNTLTRELEHIKSLSADTIKLHDDNKRLVNEYEATKRKQDTVIAENQSLQGQLRQNTFINGTIAVFLGILATLIIQHLTKSNKRHSDWA